MAFMFLNESEGGRLDPPGAEAPEIDRELPGHGDDRLLARGAGGEGAFGQGLRHFTTGRYWGWKRTSRQAVSTRAARSRGLPCLVTQLCRRVLPLLYSPGHKPV